MAYMVGEAGRELFVPATSGHIIPNDMLSSPRAAGLDGVGGMTLVVHNHFDHLLAGDARQIGEEVARMTWGALKGLDSGSYESRV